jgi:predicted O-methyltransferase YrrM
LSRRTIALDDALYDYLAARQPPEHPALLSLRTFTARLGSAIMQIAPEQGHFLAFLVKLIGARAALEIGTYTGYSALAIALAMPDDGRVVTCDINPDWVAVGRRYWKRARVEARIESRIGPASDTLDGLEAEGAGGTFDLAFIDADKAGYDGYLESCLRLVRQGGLIVLDNTLLDGTVVNPADPEAVAMDRLNARLAADERVDRVMLPVGDGMTLVRRR